MKMVITLTDPHTIKELNRMKKQLEQVSGKKVSYNIILNTMVINHHKEFHLRRLKRKLVLEEFNSPFNI